MCSQSTEDDMNSVVLESKPDFRTFRKCLKCDANSVIVTRINEALCKGCFIDYFTHKFRATIGKNKIFERDERALFAYSASQSSVAMLNLIVQGVSEEAKKKFTFRPVLLFVEDNVLFTQHDQRQPLDESELRRERLSFMQKIGDSLAYANLDVYYSLLENSFEDDDDEATTSGGAPLCDLRAEQLVFDAQRRQRFLRLVDGVHNRTSRIELIKRMRAQLIDRIARHLGIAKVLFALDCTKLTVQLLSNVAIGKGAHLATEMALEEKRATDLIHLRPLRELTSKEIAFFNLYTCKSDAVMATNTSLSSAANSTIYSLTEKFINGLQQDFPTTVATIFRTSDKLTPSDELTAIGTGSSDAPTCCVLCKCLLDTTVSLTSTSSAISDLQYSAFLANIANEPAAAAVSTASIARSTTKPYLQARDPLLSAYCYSCSIVVNDLKDKSCLPTNLRASKKTILMKSDQLREQISEFLIDNTV